ncbi:MAG TPA: transporter [Bryobacteraceae bacterium]|nr:transporter [Bryobacteraceae bacterium]
MSFKPLGMFLLTAAVLPMSFASDGGGTVYPVGAETVMPGIMPPPGKTILLEFDNFYQANGVMDGNGRSAVPGFHLRVAAFAVKVVHNWGVKALGGTLVSSAAVPLVYMHLDGPFGSVHKTGLGNPDIGLLGVAYGKGSWHWWYGVDSFAPGASYSKTDILNVGQHNMALAPVGAITWMPHQAKSELSSRWQYVVNFTNPATEYRSGREFMWEYAGMQNLTKALSVGGSGYYYQQTSDDLLNGLAVPGGDRGRAVAAGPQIKYRVGPAELIVKYQKEALVENRTRGNSFWAQVGLPLWHHEH